MPHGLLWRSMLRNVRCSSAGVFSCSSTRFWRIWMILSGCSMNTGQTSWHAPQVVHAHSVSSCDAAAGQLRHRRRARPSSPRAASRAYDEVGVRVRVVEAVRSTRTRRGRRSPSRCSAILSRSADAVEHLVADVVDRAASATGSCRCCTRGSSSSSARTRCTRRCRAGSSTRTARTCRRPTGSRPRGSSFGRSIARARSGCARRCSAARRAGGCAWSRAGS